MPDTTTGKIAEGKYEIREGWSGREPGPRVRLWREAIIPNLYKIERGEVLWAPEREDAISAIGPVRSAGFRLKIPTPKGEMPLRYLVSVYLVSAKRDPQYPRGAILFRWPKRKDTGNPVYGVEPPQANQRPSS